MRARNLISFGMAAAFAAACSNPSSEGAVDPTADLLSELEPALLVPAAGSESAVVSPGELTPANEGSAPAVATPRPRNAPARTEHTAHVDELRPEVVQAVANVPGQDAVLASATGISQEDDHAGHDHGIQIPAPGILIRGGGDIGIQGDPCIPGGHRPGNGAVPEGGVLGGIADASSTLGTMGSLVNDQTPRIGQGNLPYPRNSRSSPSRGGSMGGMGGGGIGGGGRMFIR